MRRHRITSLFIPLVGLGVALITPDLDAARLFASQDGPDTLQAENEEADKEVAEAEAKPEEAEAAAEKDDEATAAKDDEPEEKSAAKADDKPAADDDTKEEAKPADDSAKKKSSAKENAKPAAKPESKKRKTHKVEEKRLRVDVTLDGTFVASKMAEVPLRPEAWTGYEITDVVPHGKKVRKGETLIKFDDEKLNEAIADLELEQRLNELAIVRAEEELPRVEKTLKLDLENAERANEQARQDFERYNEIDRPMTVKAAEFLVKYYDFNLNYEKDELDQLEKMYKDDDLTEETEEIVLKRQRSSVEFAEFNLERAKLNREDTLDIQLPRYDIRIKEALQRAELAKARAQMAMSLDLNTARYTLEQRKKARAKSLDRHAKLLEDRGLMEIKSPADGIVFYGQNVNGRWADTATLINKYKPKSNVSPGSILMTVVESRPLFVTSTIDEGKRPDVEDGQKVKVTLPAEDAERIVGEVQSISPIPVSPGKFEITFDLNQEEIPDWVVPGMSGKVQIVTYDKKEALVVPKAAIHDDEDDEDQKYVWLVDPDDEKAKPERRNVKLGKRKGDDVEIIKGLEKGDVISLEDESKKKEDT